MDELAISNLNLSWEMDDAGDAKILAYQLREALNYCYRNNEQPYASIQGKIKVVDNKVFFKRYKTFRTKSAELAATPNVTTLTEFVLWYLDNPTVQKVDMRNVNMLREEFELFDIWLEANEFVYDINTKTIHKNAIKEI